VSVRKTIRQAPSRRKPRFSSVEEYFASLNDRTKERTLRAVVDFILSEFPDLECKISWNVPTIHRKGKYVAGICAYKHHLTFSPWSPRVMKELKVRLRKFVVFKTCFQIPVDWEIDKKIVKDLVTARLAELD
jgi:uncharacterized protein